jgi:hypothetical protein
MESSPKDYSSARSLGYDSHTASESRAQESPPPNGSRAVSGALVAYQPPPAVARAWERRGYCALQIEARAAELERKARMTAPPRPEPEPDTARKTIPLPRRFEPVPPPPPTAHELALQAVEAAAIAEAKLFLERYRSGNATVRIAAIQIACADEFAVTVNEILSERKSAQIVTPRQIGMFLCRELTHRSLREIGRYFGHRDHTTVLHAQRKVAERMDGDPGFKQRVDHVRARLDRLMTRPDADAGDTGDSPLAGTAGGAALCNAGSDRTVIDPGARANASFGSGARPPVDRPSHEATASRSPAPVYQTAASPRKWRRRKWRPRADQGG